MVDFKLRQVSESSECLFKLQGLGQALEILVLESWAGDEKSQGESIPWELTDKETKSPASPGGVVLVSRPKTVHGPQDLTNFLQKMPGL